MPGRAKIHLPPRPPAHHPHPKPMRRQAPAPSQPQPTSSELFPGSSEVDLKSQVINHDTLPWLIVVVTLVAATLVLISFLLCRCKRRRNRKKRISKGGTQHRHYPSLEVSDGRNEFGAWNKSLPQSQPQPVGLGISVVDHAGGSGGVANMWDERGRGRVQPMRIAEDGDDEAISPLTPARVRQAGRERAAGSRYYSGLSSAWKRVSQIGRAF